MTISIITLFPQMFSGPFSESIIKRAIEKKLLTIRFINLRDFGIGRHKTVDDRPYGGGLGMIIRVDVLKKAIEKARIKGLKKSEEYVILTDATGKAFNQKASQNLSNFKHLIIICGHYEGVDGRIKKYIDEKISIGDFILTGGEIPAMLIIDSVARNIKGVFKEGVTNSESFSGIGLLEEEQYTRPETFEKQSVPKILLSGNHSEIKKWRKKKSLEKTKKLRPDLL